MAEYMVRINGFHINNTRAWDEDTDYVTLSVAVNDQSPITKTVKVGDVDNGTHMVYLTISPVEVGPNDVLKFGYVIMNQGHGDTGKVIDVLTTVGASAATLAGGIWGAVAAAIKQLLGALVADCDGVVAADNVSYTGVQLEKLTERRSSYFQQRHYPGTDSPTGCGSNSDYSVTWQIKRMSH